MAHHADSGPRPRPGAPRGRLGLIGHKWPGRSSPKTDSAHTVLAGARGTHGARRHRGRRAHGGTTRSGLSMTGSALRLHDEHHGSTCGQPGKEDRTGAHWRRRAVGRRWSLAAWVLPARDELSQRPSTTSGSSCSTARRRRWAMRRNQERGEGACEGGCHQSRGEWRRSGAI
jgi:hypothetical protein